MESILVQKIEMGIPASAQKITFYRLKKIVKGVQQNHLCAKKEVLVPLMLRQVFGVRIQDPQSWMCNPFMNARFRILV